MSEQDNLIEILIKARDDESDGYMTVRELMQATGKDNDSLRDRLRELIADGQVEVKRIPRKNIAGDTQSVPGYRMIAESHQK